MIKLKKPQSGFTLIEMIVSLGVFSVVVTIAVGALLILIASNRQLQEEQSVLTNLAFALDSMTREMRTGSYFFCNDGNNNVGGSNRMFNQSNDIDVVVGPNEFQRCADGRTPPGSRYQGVTFVEGGDSITGVTNSRILYYYDQNDHTIYRRVGGSTGASSIQSIVSDGIYVVDAEFFVSGPRPLLGSGLTDQTQAAVTIVMTVAESDAVDAKQHRIQTTVVQRTLDI